MTAAVAPRALARSRPWIAERLAPFAVCILFAVVGAFAFRPGIVDWDGAAHFAYLHSALFDGDLDFSNDIVPQEALIPTPTGRIGNKHPVGPAILWAPFFLSAGGICAVVGASVSGLCQAGYGWPYVFAVSLATALYGLVGIWTMVQISRRYFPPGISLFAVFVVWLASPLLAYMYVIPSMPHAVVFMCASLFLALWWLVPGRKDLVGWFVWGLAGGLLAVVRWQEAIWSILPLCTVLSGSLSARSPHRQGALWQGCRQILCFALGMLIVFSPQMVVWNALYGSPLTIPQGDGFLMWSRPAVVEVLFSPLHGLFAWMPLAALCLIGLVAFLRRERRLALPFVLILLLELYVNSIVSDWWSGGAFGPRRFIGVLPILMLGFAEFAYWAWARRVWRLALLVVSIALIAGQWIFVAEFFTAMVRPDQPVTWPDAISLAFSPSMVLDRWLVLWPGIVGSWHMGPYGSLASTLFYGTVFAVVPLVAYLLGQRASRWLNNLGRGWRAAAVLAPFIILTIDVFLVRLR